MDFWELILDLVVWEILGLLLARTLVCTFVVALPGESGTSSFVIDICNDVFIVHIFRRSIHDLFSGMFESPARVRVQNHRRFDERVERSVLLESAHKVFGVVVQTVEEKALPELTVHAHVAVFGSAAARIAIFSRARFDSFQKSGAFFD